MSVGILALYGFLSDQMYRGGAQLSFERIHPLDVGEVKETFQKLETESKGYDIQYRFQKKMENRSGLEKNQYKPINKMGFGLRRGWYRILPKRGRWKRPSSPIKIK